MPLTLYHIVYRKNENEDQVKKTLDLINNGIKLEKSQTTEFRNHFLFFYDRPESAENPIIIVDIEEPKVSVADRTDKSENWPASIQSYKSWNKDKSKVPHPEFLINDNMPKEKITGIIYKGKAYSTSEFIDVYGSGNPEHKKMSWISAIYSALNRRE